MHTGVFPRKVSGSSFGPRTSEKTHKHIMHKLIYPHMPIINYSVLEIDNLLIVKRHSRAVHTDINNKRLETKGSKV